MGRRVAVLVGGVTQSFTQSVSQSLSQSVIQSLTHSLTHSVSHFSYSVTQSSQSVSLVVHDVLNLGIYDFLNKAIEILATTATATKWLFKQVGLTDYLEHCPLVQFVRGNKICKNIILISTAAARE